MDSGTSQDLLYSKLPSSTQRLLTVPPGAGDAQDVIKYVQNMVPYADHPKFEAEISRTFNLTLGQKKKGKRRYKKNILTLKERRELGLYRLRKNNMKYNDFLSLHQLWKEYFVEYMDLETLEKQGFRGRPTDRHWENVTRLLLKADYHGAVLTVSKSLCSSLVGKTGIIVFDTKNTFQMLSTDNELRVIPKTSCIFTLECGPYTFTIFGNHFSIRPSARSSKKMKLMMNFDLYDL